MHALDWLLSSLVENNDEVVVLRVIEPGSTAWNNWRSGEEGMDKAREKAEGVLNDVMKKNGETRQVRASLLYVGGGTDVWRRSLSSSSGLSGVWRRQSIGTFGELFGNTGADLAPTG